MLLNLRSPEVEEFDYAKFDYLARLSPSTRSSLSAAPTASPRAGTPSSPTGSCARQSPVRLLA